MLTSIRRPRHGLISGLYEARSNRCGTCGRRFYATEEGKEKKARHLDWHFKTNQRMADAAKRAQNRSWYVDERVSISFFPSGSPLDTILTENRIGSNPEKLGTIWFTLTEKLPEIIQPGPIAIRRRKGPQSNGYTPLTTQPCGIHHVPSARRSLSRHGPKTSRIGFGKMRSKLGVGYITPVVTRKSPKTGQLQRVEIHL